MPNWTANIIRAEGPEAALRAFLAHVRSDDEPFDFNTLIPMPTLLRHTASGGTTFDGKAYFSWYVIDPARQYEKRDPADPPNERPFTAEEEAALRDIGHTDWYDWSCANWGTKWNACRAAVGDIRDGAVELRFDTAWQAPHPIFTKLAEGFPVLTFTFTWTDEDEPGGGAQHYDPRWRTTMTDGNRSNRCPQCGADDEIDICASVWVRLCPDGTDVTAARNGDHDWDDDSQAICCACGFHGKVRDCYAHTGGQL